jgi:hypothetical protein
LEQFETIEPLSNFQIIEKCEELKIKNFKGCFMRDELIKNKKTSDECMIINTDHSSNAGTHWTSLFRKNGESFYFDPYGFQPPIEVIKYCEEPRYFSSFPIQKMNEVICGHYCVYVLQRLNNGDDFYNICFSLLK